MKPLIISENDRKGKGFEKNRLRKNIKGALELNEQNYSVSFYDETYQVAHFIDLEDYKKYRNENTKKIKKIISLFYLEEDVNGQVYERKIGGKHQVSKANIELINEFDTVFVPSKEAKNYLLQQGVLPRIKIVSPGVNLSKFSLENSYIRLICYRYLQLSEEMPFCISVFDYRDDDVFMRLRQIAELYPKVKFVGIYHCDKISRLATKIIKKAPQNLIFTTLLEEDIYLSLIYSAKMFLLLGSEKGCVLESYEAMAGNTQIMALNSAVFNDIVIDKETGYVYNDFASLKEGVELFLNNKLPSTITKAKEVAINNSLKVVGEKLIKIYQEI